MPKKIISAILTVFMMIQGISAPLFAQSEGGNQKSVTVEDIERLLASQEKEFNMKLSIRTSAAAITGAVVMGGGIFAYYTHKRITGFQNQIARFLGEIAGLQDEIAGLDKQLASLDSRNSLWLNKLPKMEKTIDEIIKTSVTINAKAAEASKLGKTNREYLEQLAIKMNELIDLLNYHGDMIDDLKEVYQRMSGGASGQGSSPKIGFYVRGAEEKTVKMEKDLGKNLKSLKNIGKKAGLLGLLAAAVITTLYVYNKSEELSSAPLANKRAEYKRYLDDAYKNDEGFFILDVLALSYENRKMTASLLYENIGKDRDYYKLFLEQHKLVKEAACEAKAKGEIRGLISDALKSQNGNSEVKIPFMLKESPIKDYLNSFAI